jgi:hypothetical protein
MLPAARVLHMEKSMKEYMTLRAEMEAQKEEISAMKGITLELEKESMYLQL